MVGGGAAGGGGGGGGGRKERENRSKVSTSVSKSRLQCRVLQRFAITSISAKHQPHCQSKQHRNDTPATLSKQTAQK